MSSSTEHTLEYLASEVLKKTQLELHHQNGNTQDSTQISTPIIDLVLRSKILQLNIAKIDHATTSVLISPKQSLQLINDTVDLLLNDHDAATQTLKLQFMLSSMSSALDEETANKIQNHTNIFNEQIAQITKITPYNTTTIRQLYDQLFDLMCVNERYIEQLADDEALDSISEREITAALTNVFPQAEIKQYKALPNKEKIVQIRRLIDVIYGIRLYDRDTGKGGSSITDIPKLIEMDLSELFGDISSKLEMIEAEIQNYTKIIEMEYAKPGTITVPLLSLQCDLRNRYQFMEYLKHYKQEIIQSTEILNTVIQQFDDELKSLHVLFKSGENPLKTHVYPKFAQLSYFWKLMIAEK
eukprot:190404_1